MARRSPIDTEFDSLSQGSVMVIDPLERDESLVTPPRNLVTATFVARQVEEAQDRIRDIPADDERGTPATQRAAFLFENGDTMDTFARHIDSALAQHGVEAETARYMCYDRPYRTVQDGPIIQPRELYLLTVEAPDLQPVLEALPAQIRGARQDRQID